MMKLLSVSVIGLFSLVTALLSCAGSSRTQTKSGQPVTKNLSATEAGQVSKFIPSAMQTDWSRVGLLPGTPPGTTGKRADAVIDVTKEPGDNWDEKVQSAVQKAKDAAGTIIIYFPRGTYRLSRPVVLSDPSFSGIVFQGEDADSTILEFTLGRDGNCFDMSGAEPGPKLALDSNLEKGNTGFSAPGLSNGFSKGDWVRLCEAGFPEADPQNVGQTTLLAGVDGNHGTFADEATKTYLKTNDLWILKIQPIRGIGFENFTLLRMDQKEATQSAYGRGINFKFDNAADFWIKGVSSINTCRHHVVINHSAYFEISGCSFAEACSRDENSYGYGVLLEVCTNNGLIQNNIFEHLRHSMTVCEGVSGNVLAFNYSTKQAWRFHGLPNPYQGADLCLHGRYPYANLFEQNIVEYVYADNSHGANGPYNVFLRNQIYHGFKGSGKIRLFKSPYTVVLGNMSTSENAAQIQYDRCEPFSDIFANRVDGTGWQNHRGVRSQKLRTEDVRLPLISYYYRIRPDFLGSSYTWPSIGPSVDGQSLTQSIPAKERCLLRNKVYIQERTMLKEEVSK